MTSMNFTQDALAAAAAEGVRQCVVIGSRPEVDFDKSADAMFEVFAITEHQPAGSPATFLSTQFSTEALETALEKTNFDKSKPSFFVWLGEARYSTVHAVLATLSFIASLPKGTAVVLDYVAECTPRGSRSHAALDALASRISAAGRVKYLIQPQAVTTLLRSLGFQKVTEPAQEEVKDCGRRFVTAVV